MTTTPSTGPRVAYLDTCVASAIAKRELSSADSQAVARLGELVQSSAVTLWTSTVMLEEIHQIPEPYRGPHLDAYNGLRTVAGHPTTAWLDDGSTSSSPGQAAVHPMYDKLRKLLPDENDARHLFQAKMNGVPDFITVDKRTILSRGTEISRTVGIKVWSPAQYVRAIESGSS